uniref:Uncharacterized protein n=1 Tax=Lepeophtheirus salmonis TaxID=72036 RepID=A0A0K2UAS8_LEPSM
MPMVGMVRIVQVMMMVNMMVIVEGG